MKLGADGMAGAVGVALQHALEVAEAFRQAVVEEGRRSRFRLLLLVVVIELGRDRMVRVVNLGDEVGHGELQPVGEEAQRLGGRREAEPGAR